MHNIEDFIQIVQYEQESALDMESTCNCTKAKSSPHPPAVPHTSQRKVKLVIISVFHNHHFSCNVAERNKMPIFLKLGNNTDSTYIIKRWNGGKYLSSNESTRYGNFGWMPVAFRNHLFPRSTLSTTSRSWISAAFDMTLNGMLGWPISSSTSWTCCINKDAHVKTSRCNKNDLLLFILLNNSPTRTFNILKSQYLKY